jgi:hypothetical protein
MQAQASWEADHIIPAVKYFETACKVRIFDPHYFSGGKYKRPQHRRRLPLTP